MGKRKRLSSFYRAYGKAILIGGVASFVALYAFLLLPATDQALFAFERRVSRALNGALLVSPMWDWTLIFASSKPWIYLSMAFCIFVMCVEGWLRRAKDFGRVFGYALFVVGLTALAEIAGDKISDALVRDSPWSQMEDLVDLREKYDDEDLLDMNDETGVPDEDVVGWSCLLFLLLIRLPRTATAGFVFFSLHILAQISVGNRWLWDMVSAICLGASFAGTGLILLRGVALNFERESERVFVSRFWRLLPQVRDGDRERLPRLGARANVALDENLLSKPRNYRRLWKHAVEKAVVPLFNVRGGPCDLLSRPPGELGKKWRPSGNVRFLQLPTGEVLVVKLVVAAGLPWRRPTLIKRYMSNAECNLALERLGLPAPRLYWMREGPAYLGFGRFFLLVEECLDGRTIDSKNHALLGECMKLLARIHAERRASWGPLTDSAPRPPAQFIWQEMRPETLYMLRRIERRARAAWPDELAERIWALFEARAKALLADPARQFRLTHGDVGVRNFMDCGGRIRIIDFVTVGFGLAGAEIIRAVHTLTDGGPNRRRLAWEAYFEAAGEERWREFLQEANLGLARHALRELAHGRARGLKEGAALPDAQALYDWIESLINLPAEAWGERPSGTDWDRIAAMVFDAPAAAQGIKATA